MIIVTAVAVIALIVVVVGLASLAPKSKPQSVNELPAAKFSYDANNLTVVLNASASSDPDGSIANYSWTYGDGSEGNGKVVTHEYALNGTFKVNLTVTDNGGGKNSTSKEVTVELKVSPPKKYPVAVIRFETFELKVNLSGAMSHAQEDNATIVSYEWTFGDGANASGVTVKHNYSANGTYNITLTVTDSNGLTANATVSVTVASPPTPPPPPPPPPPQRGPPGLLHAIEIHKEKADRNGGLSNSLNHLEDNLQKWLDAHAASPTI